MSRPLEDALKDHRDLSEPESRADAEAVLEALFVEAQSEANAYTAERLQEVYEVADRALALGSAFPPPVPLEQQDGATTRWFLRLPDLLAQYGGGLLLAACAPLVADASVLLAAACGVGAVLTIAANRKPRRTAPKPLPPKAVQAKLEGLLSAADRSLASMTAPRALEAPPKSQGPFAEDDVITFLQDAAAETGDIGENAERLLSRAGYKVVRDGPSDLFEVMIDPEVKEPILLKPALVHHTDSKKTVFGVKVRGRN